MSQERMRVDVGELTADVPVNAPREVLMYFAYAQRAQGGGPIVRHIASTFETSLRQVDDLSLCEVGVPNRLAFPTRLHGSARIFGHWPQPTLTGLGSFGRGCRPAGVCPFHKFCQT
jgi:hypothetical protein